MTEVFEIVKQILWSILSEMVKTVINLLKLFYELLKAISPISTSGPQGFLLTVIVVGSMAFVVGKYIFHVGKNAIILLILGLIIFLAVVSIAV